MPRHQCCYSECSCTSFALVSRLTLSASQSTNVPTGAGGSGGYLVPSVEVVSLATLPVVTTGWWWNSKAMAVSPAVVSVSTIQLSPQLMVCVQYNALFGDLSDLTMKTTTQSTQTSPHMSAIYIHMSHGKKKYIYFLKTIKIYKIIKPKHRRLLRRLCASPRLP